jgi:hypothetical protein
MRLKEERPKMRQEGDRTEDKGVVRELYEIRGCFVNKSALTSLLAKLLGRSFGMPVISFGNIGEASCESCEDVFGMEKALFAASLPLL